MSGETECRHCWHVKPGAFYFGFPPRQAVVCCWCGDERPEPLPFEEQHGPHRPGRLANEFICPMCGQPGIVSALLPCCTNCANRERGV